MSFLLRVLNSPSAGLLLSLLLSCALAGTCAQLGYELGRGHSAIQIETQQAIRIIETERECPKNWTDSDLESGELAESNCPVGTLDTGSSCSVSVPPSKLL